MNASKNQLVYVAADFIETLYSSEHSGRRLFLEDNPDLTLRSVNHQLLLQESTFRLVQSDIPCSRAELQPDSDMRNYGCYKIR
eukprot:4459580-Amphidinium_carterae.1